MAGKPRRKAEGSDGAQRVPWSWEHAADIDLELKPAAGGSSVLSLPSPDCAARCAYRLLLQHGGEDLLLALQEHLCCLSRAAFLRRFTAAR